MAIHPMILDNRIHRTILIGTNLVPASDDYVVMLNVVNNQDLLVVTKKSDGSAAVPPIPLVKSYTPPQCPSSVSYHNADCQYPLQLDDQIFRVIELRQNLVDTGKPTDYVVLVDAPSADYPHALHAHKLLINISTFNAIMDDGGFKVPPDLG